MLSDEKRQYSKGNADRSASASSNCIREPIWCIAWRVRTIREACRPARCITSASHRRDIDANWIRNNTTTLDRYLVAPAMVGVLASLADGF